MGRRLIALLAVAIAGWAQGTQIDLRTQAKNPDFSNYSWTRPMKVGIVAPLTCNVGDQFFNSAAAPGANLFACTTPNTWVVMGTGISGGATTQYLRGGDFTWQTLNTAVVPESGNMYFTTARALAAVTWGTMTGIPSTFPPSAHAASHQNGGSDEIAAWSPAANAIPKAMSTGKLAQGWIDFTGYQPSITLGNTAQYFRGDLSLATFPTTWPWSGLTGVPSTFAPINTGDWAGTWQTHAPSYFQTAITTGSTAQYFRGDFSLATFPTTWPWSGLTGVEGSTVTLSVGYPGLAWSDFALLHTYVLREILPSDGYTSFIFICQDAQLLEKKTIYAHPENGYLLSDDNPWYLCGTPAEIFQAIVLFALGLPVTAIDQVGLAALDSPQQGIFASWRPFLFALTKSFEAKQFLETEIFKPSGLYQVALPTGQLSLRSMRPPAAGASPVFTFTEDNLVTFPKWDRQPIVNQAIWQFDYDGSDYQNYETFLQATSISQYDQGQQFSVTSQGLRTEYGAFAYAEWVTSRLFRRFSGVAPAIKGGAPLLTVRAMLMTLPVWVGDYVGLTHTKMPDITTGNLGVTNRIFEVIERQPDYAGGVMTYKLLDSGLTGQPAAYEWGASSARPLLIGTSPVY